MSRKNKGLPPAGCCSKQMLIKAAVALLNDVDRGRRLYEVYRSWLCLFACSLAQAPYRAVGAPISKPIEDRYMKEASRWTSEQLKKFTELSGLFLQYYEQNLPGVFTEDILGSLYMAEELGNAKTGQFFTPSSVSTMMGRIALADFDTDAWLKANRILTIDEPASGSGGMLLAALAELSAKNFPYWSHAALRATDIDEQCFFMTFIQLSLVGAAAEVNHGNTLSMEMWQTWYTPAWVLNRVGSRLRCQQTQKKEVPEMTTTDTVTEEKEPMPETLQETEKVIEPSPPPLEDPTGFAPDLKIALKQAITTLFELFKDTEALKHVEAMVTAMEAVKSPPIEKALPTKPQRKTKNRVAKKKGFRRDFKWAARLIWDRLSRNMTLPSVNAPAFMTLLFRVRTTGHVDLAVVQRVGRATPDLLLSLPPELAPDDLKLPSGFPMDRWLCAVQNIQWSWWANGKPLSSGVSKGKAGQIKVVDETLRSTLEVDAGYAAECQASAATEAPQVYEIEIDSRRGYFYLAPQSLQVMADALEAPDHGVEISVQQFKERLAIAPKDTEELLTLGSTNGWISQIPTSGLEHLDAVSKALRKGSGSWDPPAPELGERGLCQWTLPHAGHTDEIHATYMVPVRSDLGGKSIAVERLAHVNVLSGNPLLNNGASGGVWFSADLIEVLDGLIRNGGIPQDKLCDFRRAVLPGWRAVEFLRRVKAGETPKLEDTETSESGLYHISPSRMVTEGYADVVSILRFSNGVRVAWRDAAFVRGDLARVVDLPAVPWARIEQIVPRVEVDFTRTATLRIPLQDVSEILKHLRAWKELEVIPLVAGLPYAEAAFWNSWAIGVASFGETAGMQTIHRHFVQAFDRDRFSATVPASLEDSIRQAPIMWVTPEVLAHSLELWQGVAGGKKAAKNACVVAKRVLNASTGMYEDMLDCSVPVFLTSDDDWNDPAVENPWVNIPYRCLFMPCAVASQSEMQERLSRMVLPLPCAENAESSAQPGADSGDSTEVPF